MKSMQMTANATSPTASLSTAIGRRQFVGALAALPLLWSSSATAQLGGFPPAPDISVKTLLADSPYVAGRAPLDGNNAKAHAEALKSDPLHNKHYWVSQVSGNTGSKRVVFVIPQFHQSPSQPLAWTSMGKEIGSIQSNIDTVLVRLAQSHDVSCVGTEGSAQPRIPSSYALQQLAWWHNDLTFAYEDATLVLEQEAEAVRNDMKLVYNLLDKELRAYAAYIDGVGAAQERLASTVNFDRFGIEDTGLNRNALALLKKLRAVERKLAKLDPSTQTEVQDAMAKMWLDEFPRYNSDVLEPLEKTLARLDMFRRTLRTQNAEPLASSMGRFIALSRRITGFVVQREEVLSTTEYYRELDAKVANTKSKKPSAADRAQIQTLSAQRKKILSDYTRVAHTRREHVAAKRVLEHLDRQNGNATCAVVMGMHHTRGLIDQIIKRGRAKGIGVVVVSPFDPAEMGGQ